MRARSSSNDKKNDTHTHTSGFNIKKIGAKLKIGDIPIIINIKKIIAISFLLGIKT